MPQRVDGCGAAVQERTMRIRFQVSGGIAFFPGLARPAVIDVESLEAEDRQSVERLLRESRFFERAERPAPARAGPDRQTYRITIEDSRGRYTVTVTDPVADPPMAQLIDLLRNLESIGQ